MSTQRQTRGNVQLDKQHSQIVDYDMVGTSCIVIKPTKRDRKAFCAAHKRI